MDILAKQPLRSEVVDFQVQLSKTEGKGLIRKHTQKRWRILGVPRYRQTLIHNNTKTGWGWKEALKEPEGGDSIDTAENWTYWVKRDTTLNWQVCRWEICEQCGVIESVQHVMMECGKYGEERRVLKAAVFNLDLDIYLE